MFAYRVAFIVSGCGPAATTQFSQHSIRRHHTLNTRGHVDSASGHRGLTGRVDHAAVLETEERPKSQHLNVAVDSPHDLLAVSSSLKVAASCTTRWINILTKPLFRGLRQSLSTGRPPTAGVSYHVHIDGKTKTLRL